MLDSQTISISIDRPCRAVYDAIWRPEDFAKWASGLAQSALEPDGQQWTGQGPEGPITVRFTPYNPYGVMDHFVGSGAAAEIYVPMRVIANGQGAVVSLVLFRQPDMSDDRYAADAAWIRRDLMALKALFED
jgi:hypothetical protein